MTTKCFFIFSNLPPPHNFAFKYMCTCMDMCVLLKCLLEVCSVVKPMSKGNLLKFTLLFRKWFYNARWTQISDAFSPFSLHNCLVTALHPCFMIYFSCLSYYNFSYLYLSLDGSFEFEESVSMLCLNMFLIMDKVYLTTLMIMVFFMSWIIIRFLLLSVFFSFKLGGGGWSWKLGHLVVFLLSQH